MSGTRTEWIARCGCQSDCTVQMTYSDEAQARRMVAYYACTRQGVGILVRRDIAITERITS